MWVSAGTLDSITCFHFVLWNPTWNVCELCLCHDPPLHFLLGNGYAFQICQLKKKSSLPRPLSQYEIARQIFWSEVLNYPCHLKLRKLLEGLLLPRLILFSWWNFLLRISHMHIVCFDKSNCPPPTFSPFQFLAYRCSTFLSQLPYIEKLFSQLLEKFITMYFDHIHLQFLPY